MTPTVAVPVWTCTVEGQPVPKARPRLGRNGNTYTPKRTKDAEYNIGWAMQMVWRQGVDATSLFGVRLRFYLRNNRTSDVDNLTKTVMDAMNGVIVRDDRQVRALDVAAFVDRERPRSEISWWRI